MDIYDEKFDEIFYSNILINLYRNEFSPVNYAEMLNQADNVIKNTNETSSRIAQALVKKFQLLALQYKLAPKLLEKALELYPDMPQALAQMGRFYSLTKKKEKALTYYYKAAEAAPPYPYAWLLIAGIKYKRNDFWVFQYYSEYKKLKPNSVLGYRMELDLLYDRCYKKIEINKSIRTKDIPKIKRDIKQAFYDINEIIRIQPDNYKNYQLRVQLYKWNHKIEKKNTIDPAVINELKELIILAADEKMEHDELFNLREPVGFIRNILYDISKEEREIIIKKIKENIPQNTNAYWLASIIQAEDFILEEEGIELYNKIINEIKEDNMVKLFCYTSRVYLYYLYELSFSKKICKLKQEKIISDLTETIEYINNLENKGLNYLRDKVYDFEIIDMYFTRARNNEKNDKIKEAIDDYSSVIKYLRNGKNNDKLKQAYEARSRIYRKIGEKEKAFADYCEMSELKDDSWLEDCFTSVPEYVILQ